MPVGEPASTIDRGSRGWALLAGGTCLLPLLLQLPALLGPLLTAVAVLIVLLAWRQPVPGWLRLVLAAATIAVVMLMSGFRIGRDTGAALLAAMIALKPAETFTIRDARSLVGFGLFAPFAAFLLDQGPLTLALGLLAVVVSLVALQRLADAESGTSLPAPLDWRALAGTGRLLALGLPLALAVFWLFPRFASPLWGVPDRALARPGLSDRMSPDDWVDLLSDESPVLRARFFGAVPERSRMYWRGPVLWDFDGTTWTRPRGLAGRPRPVIRYVSGTRWDYEMALEPTDQRVLVALDLPLAAPADASMTIDATLRTPRPLAQLSRWRMRSAPAQAFQPELPPLLRQRALALPAGFNPRTLALGARWRQEAGSDDSAIVRRALGWIRSDFAYSLNVPRVGRDSIDAFLFGHRTGYCEHFSSAFTVLMRAAGIPARVVTGYAGGYLNAVGDYWLVRRSDAHAWVEVWLPREGWVRVDPTAAVAPERIYDTLADRAPGRGGLFDLGSAVALYDVGDWLRRGWNDFVLGFDARRQERLLRPLGIERLTPGALALLFALATAVALGWMLWLSLRDPRERDPVLRAWHRLGERYAAFDLARAPHEPAGAWAERVRTMRPDLAPPLTALTLRFIDWRYAPGQPAGGTARELARALDAHRPRPRAPD